MAPIAALRSRRVEPVVTAFPPYPGTSPTPEWAAQLDLKPRDFKRAAEWLERTGGLPWITSDAWLLLVARLRISQRTVGLLILALVVGCASGFFLFRPDSTATRVALVLWIYSVVGVAFYLGSRSATRKSMRLAEAAGTRVTRGRRVSVLEVVGVTRGIAFVVIFAAQSVYVVAVWFDYPRSYASASTIAFAAEWAAIAALVVGVWRRPTIAIDAQSLAVDERLRSQDAAVGLVFTAFGGWAMLLIIRSAHPPTVDLYFFALVLQLVGALAPLLVGQPRRWANPYRRNAWWTM